MKMKKTLVITAISLILAVSLAGCGCKKTSNNEQGTSGTDNVYTQDVEQNYSQNVDMEKVQGDQTSSDTAEDAYNGKIGNAEVSIGDAKIIDYEGDRVAVISFDFTNTGDQPISFTSVLKVIASQNLSDLPPATVFGVEGVELNSISDLVAKGQTITVQRAYKLRDESAPLTVNVVDFNAAENSAVLEKTFTF